MVQQWVVAFTVFCGRFAARFPRVESRRRIAGYVRGLLAELERKNGWSLAEAAGDTGPEGVQRLLNSYSWDTDGLRDDVRQVVLDAIGGPRSGGADRRRNGPPEKRTRFAGVALQC